MEQICFAGCHNADGRETSYGYFGTYRKILCFSDKEKIWKEMLELPVIFQVNADFHDNRKKRKVVKS